MIEVGILTGNDSVELIDGEIVSMAAVGSFHAGTVNRLTGFLVRTLGDRAVVSVQNPVQLSDDTEPEPVLAMLQPRDDFYTSANPLPADLLLLVEVGDSSFLANRHAKAPRYARAGIRECWLVNLEAGTIERYTAPNPDGYRELATVLRGQRLASTVVADLTFDGDRLLGPAYRSSDLSLGITFRFPPGVAGRNAPGFQCGAETITLRRVGGVGGQVAQFAWVCRQVVQFLAAPEVAVVLPVAAAQSAQRVGMALFGEVLDHRPVWPVHGIALQ